MKIFAFLVLFALVANASSKILHERMGDQGRNQGGFQGFGGQRMMFDNNVDEKWSLNITQGNDTSNANDGRMEFTQEDKAMFDDFEFEADNSSRSNYYYNCGSSYAYSCIYLSSSHNYYVRSHTYTGYPYHYPTNTMCGFYFAAPSYKRIRARCYSIGIAVDDSMFLCSSTSCTRIWGLYYYVSITFSSNYASLGLYSSNHPTWFGFYCKVDYI